MEQNEMEKLKEDESYQEALDILNKIKQQKEIPDSRIATEGVLPPY